jgi:hypothetical protein
MHGQLSIFTDFSDTPPGLHTRGGFLRSCIAHRPCPYANTDILIPALEPADIEIYRQGGGGPVAQTQRVRMSQGRALSGQESEYLQYIHTTQRRATRSVQNRCLHGHREGRAIGSRGSGFRADYNTYNAYNAYNTGCLIWVGCDAPI